MKMEMTEQGVKGLVKALAPAMEGILDKYPEDPLSAFVEGAALAVEYLEQMGPEEREAFEELMLFAMTDWHHGTL